jgi:hypothetical protein
VCSVRFVPRCYSRDGLGQPVRSRPSVFIREPAATVNDRSILSLGGACYIKVYDGKGSVKMSLVVSLKVLGAKTNCLATNRSHKVTLTLATSQLQEYSVNSQAVKRRFTSAAVTVIFGVCNSVRL